MCYILHGQTVLAQITLESSVSWNKTLTEPALWRLMGFDMHPLFVRAENETSCFHNPHLGTAFCEKVGIIALCLCTCVIPKSQKTLLESRWKSPEEPLVAWEQRQGWSGCNILKLAMIAEYSGKGKWVHISLCYFYLSSLKSQRQKSGREACKKKVLFEILLLVLFQPPPFQILPTNHI